MRSKIITVLLLLLSASAFSQLNSYSYKRKLNAVASENYYAVPLLPEVLAACKSGSDLRIYNAGEKDTVEIPYLMQWLGDKTEETPIPFELINDVTHLKCCSYVTLKMSKKKVINRIYLDVAENNFDKLLSIEGSNDNKEWFTIRQHMRIVGFQNAENNFKSTALYFSSAEYSYFRIKFDDDSSDKITVTSASAFETSITKGNYAALPVKAKQQTEHKKEKTSEFIVELPADYLVSYITLKSNSKTDFYRDVNIYRSNGIYHMPKKDEELWEQVGSGIVSSNEDNVFALNNTKTKKLKIEIINYDNQPISLDEIKLFAEKAQLVAKLAVSDHLYIAYGKENAEAPVYDLVHFKEKIPAVLTEVNYGNEEISAKENVSASVQPLMTDKKWLWIVMLIVILVIGYFALNMLRKEKEGNSGQ
ncbi:MAG: hypothetical protein JWP12_77 [Bacteroidetes bacterium]|nr:hypothetical protein [Bacteroidota bacterium]